MNRSRRIIFPALVSAGLLWGTTVPLSKLALGWLSPAELAFIRFALAAAILMLASRGRLRAATSPAILATGALGYGGSVILQNFGIERTSVSHAALLIGATPVLIAIMAAAFGHSVARPAAWAGFGLSLAGVAVIAAGHGGGASLGGDGLVLAGQLASAGFTVAQARLLPGRDPVAVTAMQLMAAALVTLPLAAASGGPHAGQPSLSAMLATGGLVLAGTVAPTALFAFGQSRVSADVAGAFLNLEPLVGAIAGIFLFGDPLGVAQVAGGMAILAGIGLSSLSAVSHHGRSTATVGSGASPVPSGGPLVVSSGGATVSSRAMNADMAPEATAAGPHQLPARLASQPQAERHGIAKQRAHHHKSHAASGMRHEQRVLSIAPGPTVQRSRRGGTSMGGHPDKRATGPDDWSAASVTGSRFRHGLGNEHAYSADRTGF